MAGFLLVLALPALVILLFFTLMAIPLGLVVMVLFRPLLLLGWLIGALFVARWLATHASPAEVQPLVVPYGWMVVAVASLMILSAVPLGGRC